MLYQVYNLIFELCCYFRFICYLYSSYLFHIVLLNPCFKFPKYLILLFINKEITETKCLVLVIMKFTPVTLLRCSINTQSFVQDKSSSTSQFIKVKSRDLKKLLQYLSGIVTSMFKNSTGGCAGQSASPGFPD